MRVLPNADAHCSLAIPAMTADSTMQEELLNAAADTARRRREAAEAAATPQERVALFAAKKERARTLQQQQVLATPTHTSTTSWVPHVCVSMISTAPSMCMSISPKGLEIWL